MNAAVEQARKPWPDRAAIGPEPVVEAPARVLGFRFDHPVQVVSAMQYRRVQWTSRRLAALRTARCAVAIERYRLAHDDALPARLDDLVPALLPAVLIDPFSGAPVKYTRFDERYVVYSLGINRRDEGGRQLTGPKSGARDQLDAAPDIGVEVSRTSRTTPARD